MAEQQSTIRKLIDRNVERQLVRELAVLAKVAQSLGHKLHGGPGARD